MKYEKLSKLYYKLDSSSYEGEIEKRKCGYGSYLTSLKIRGFKRGNVTDNLFELFYVNTHYLMMLHSEVLLNSAKISSLISQLPPFVVDSYFKKLIINEAQSSNEIEGVRSTKKELKEALSELEKASPKNKRFVGLMKTYSYIDRIKPFENIEDFRKLYDELVSDEIESNDTLDGELFRKGYVEINNGNVTTHIGLSSEEKIVEALGSLVHYLNDVSHPELYRYMVAHYYYEYIHPFYDGNGRTGRLIVGSYLSRYLEKYSAITFSYAVNKDKSKYYKSLEEIASPLNRGDMTFYLISVLELLSDGQAGVIEDLELSLIKLERIEAYFKKDIWKDHNNESIMLNLMVSLSVFFKEGATLSLQDLMEISNKSRHIVNKAMDYLVDEGYVEVIRKKPKTYRLCDECLETILGS